MLPTIRAVLTAASLSLLGLLICTNLGSAQPAPADAKKPSAQGVEFFETKIRPVLVAQCYECHSEKSSKVKGGLLLDTRQGLLQGGDSGPALAAGKPGESLLLKALAHGKLKMPPKEKLPDAVIADFERWIAMGAPDPREGTASAVVRVTLEDARTWWSLKPLAKPALPAAPDRGWARSDIDRFIFAKLHAQGLKPVADADARTLVRRLYFDLVGLPPTPEQVEAFVAAHAADASAAVERTADELLASPRFGERWGRYWLDIARYAESNGNADNVPFPTAWRFRDWVIAAVNQDKPYDQFIREQIAGDLLPAATDAQRDQQFIATGFLALTSKPRAQNNPDYRFDLIADQIDVTTRGVLGLSVLCARCHDHKFDPVPTREYYSLAGIFDSSVMLFGANAGKGAKGAAGGAHTLSDGGTAMGVKDGKAVDTSIRLRGETAKIGESVPRGLLTAPSIAPAPAVNKAQSGRLELAQWLTSRDNPLTARVAANRIWLHLFGEGICRSPDNFGALGEQPSHPELLDHLAVQFVDQGWSTKKLIKIIVLSRTYQLASVHDAASAKADPDNRLLWRMNRRRLDAEAGRDAMLAVSGKLRLEPPTGSLSTFTGAKGGANKKGPPPESDHRSVYLGIVRGAPLPESLAVFDVANPNLVVAQREVTTVPVQALYLLNSPFVIDQARGLAQRVLDAKALDDDARVDLAYRIALARPASDVERRRALDFVAQLSQEKDPAAVWAGFAQALLASAEFRYVR